MNKYHQEIVGLYESYTGAFQSKLKSGYIGSSKFSYPISTPESRRIFVSWLKDKNFTKKEYKELLDSLSRGKSHNEFGAIGKLLEYLPELRRTLRPKFLDYWLGSAEGWAEVDNICQGQFSAPELLENWVEWKRFIKELNSSENVHKKRASLVLLTSPVRHSQSKKLSDMAFKNIDKLLDEKDILITKAVSWMLRDLTKNHRNAVESYLKKKEDFLPRVVVRETKNKLKTGRKQGK